MKNGAAASTRGGAVVVLLLVSAVGCQLVDNPQLAESTASEDGTTGPTLGTTSNGPTGPITSTTDPMSTTGPVLDGSTTGMPSTSTGDPASSSSSSSSSSESSTGPDVPVMPLLEITAALAECNAPANLDPTQCADLSEPGMEGLVVDQTAVYSMMDVGPIRAYLRFDFDDTLVPDAVVSVTLRMHTTTAGNAGGDASGEIHRVVPFVADDLLTGQPATVELLAPDQGAVALDTMVEWPLPSNVLAGGEPSLYLAVLPLSTNGLDYWRLGTAAPPMLIVEQMP